MGESRSIGSLVVRIAADGLGLYKADMSAMADSTEQAASKAKNAVDKQTSSMEALIGVAKTVAASYAAYKVVDMVRDMTMLNARYQELGIVMTVVGKNAGYNATQMERYALETQNMGISMIESRNTVIQLAQAQIDLADSSKLARVAQDAAVIGATNSSDALQRMIYGIKSGQIDVLKTIGINVNFEQSYKKLADSLHISTSALSENQKMHARENAVLEEGGRLVGTYEAAMTSASKQIRSMTRYTDDLKVMLGETFNEVLTVAVMGYTEHLKDANKEVSAMAASGELKAWGTELKDIFVAVANAIDNSMTQVKMLSTWAAKGKLTSDIADSYSERMRNVAPGPFGLAEYSKLAAQRDAEIKSALDVYEESQVSLAGKVDRILRADVARTAAKIVDAAAQTSKAFTEGYAKHQGVERPKSVSNSVTDSKAVKDAVKEAAAGLALYNDLMDKSAGFTTSWAEDTNKLRAALDRKTISQMQYNTAIDELFKKQPLMVDAAKAEAEWQKEVIKANKDADKARTDSLHSLQEELDKQLEHNASIGLTAIALADLAVTKLTDQALNKDSLAITADMIDFSGKLGDKYRQEAQALRDLAAAKVAGAVMQTNFDAAQDMAKDQKKAAEESSKYWEDAMMRAFESGKGFFQGLWDTIKNTLKTSILKVLIQPVTSAIAGVGLSGSAMAADGTSATSTLGVAGNLATLYNTVTKGISASASTAYGSFASSSMGQSLGLWTKGNNASASGMTATGTTVGTVAGYAGGIAAGKMIGDAISNGHGQNATVNAGVIVGAIVGGPIGAAIGGAIGGALNAAFGHGATELTASGTKGTFANSGFTGSNYANYKQDGGWFTSDKNWTDNSPLAQATVKAYSDSFAGVKSAVAGMADSLGLASDKVASYSKVVDIAAGSTADQITAIFTGMADDMASAIAPAIADFAKSGETASTTLSRLSTSITTANAWLSMLRNRLYDVSLAGADAASKLADAFGGLDNLAASSKAYYEAYYTEAEKTATSSENLAKAMALIGVAMPDTKAAFKDVVSGLDLTTESGRTAYATLLALAPEFATTTDAIDKAASDAAKALVDTFTGKGDLTDVLDAAALSIGDVADGAGTMETALTSINKILGDPDSGIYTLGGTIATLGEGMTDSQISAGLLSDQIDVLRKSAGDTTVDMDALSIALLGIDALPVGTTMDDVNKYLTGIDALPVGTTMDDVNKYLTGIDALPVGATMDDVNKYLDGINALPVGTSIEAVNSALNGVNTETFVATIAAVFDNLASRIKGVIGDINTERIAVRDAAISIINPTVMSKQSIQAGIAGIGTTLPSNAGVVNANAALSFANSTSDKDAAAWAAFIASSNKALTAAQTYSTGLATKYAGLSEDWIEIQKKYGGVYANATYTGGFQGVRDALQYNPTTNRISGYAGGNSTTWGDWGGVRSCGVQR